MECKRRRRDCFVFSHYWWDFQRNNVNYVKDTTLTSSAEMVLPSCEVMETLRLALRALLLAASCDLHLSRSCSSLSFSPIHDLSSARPWYRCSRKSLVESYSRSCVLCSLGNKMDRHLYTAVSYVYSCGATKRKKSLFTRTHTFAHIHLYMQAQTHKNQETDTGK